MSNINKAIGGRLNNKAKYRLALKYIHLYKIG